MFLLSFVLFLQLLESFTLKSSAASVATGPRNSKFSALHVPHQPGETGAIGRIQTRPTVVHRPRDLAAFHQRRRAAPKLTPFDTDQELEWDTLEVLGPNVEDRYTLAQLARMAGNAYALPGRSNWYEVDEAWRMSFPFGWDDEDGFRGHVFMSADNNTVVLSIKGTTVNGPTSRLDKFNDNLMFSCCCAKASFVLKSVCDCFAGKMKCDDRCLTDALVQESLFYSTGTALVDDLFRIYPTANVWLVGHSLGGALASLLGVTYGLPAVAFEAPGERKAGERLNLPIPPATDSPPQDFNSWQDKSGFLPTPRPPRPPPPESPLASYITHVYHTADPIPFGTCSGLYSPCATFGYALETHCHLGKSIILDTVNKLGWLVNVQKHVIKEVVHLLDPPEEGGRAVDWGEIPIPREPDEGPGEPPDPWQTTGSRALRLSMDVVRRMGLGILSDVMESWLVEGNPEGTASLGLPRFPGRKKKKEKEGEEDDEDDEPAISNRVPKPVVEDNCVDCQRWEFGAFKDSWDNRPVREAWSDL